MSGSSFIDLVLGPGKDGVTVDGQSLSLTLESVRTSPLVEMTN